MKIQRGLLAGVAALALVSLFWRAPGLGAQAAENWANVPFTFGQSMHLTGGAVDVVGDGAGLSLVDTNGRPNHSEAFLMFGAWNPNLGRWQKTGSISTLWGDAGPRGSAIMRFNVAPLDPWMTNYNDIFLASYGGQGMTFYPRADQTMADAPGRGMIRVRAILQIVNTDGTVEYIGH